MYSKNHCISQILRNKSLSTCNSVRSMPLRSKVQNPLFFQFAMNSTGANKESSVLPADESYDVIFNQNATLRVVELNRPKKLNSLNFSMVKKIIPRLIEWEKSDVASVVVLKGAGGKALCAGGDIAELANAIKNHGELGSKEASSYFNYEYMLDHLIAVYSKPYVSIMDGIVMGGGVGLSVHAPFRIATEKTLFAMPETTIGFFPDVGATFFLSRLDGELGTYLALTSNRLKGYDTLVGGIATHFVPSSRIKDLEERLAELQTPGAQFDPKSKEYFDSVNTAIESFAEDSVDGFKSEIMGNKRKLIDEAFAYDSVEEILAALDKVAQDSNHKYSDFAKQTANTIRERSPTSCKVALQTIRKGKKLDILSALIEEAKIASSFMKLEDFVEGVESKLIHKPAKTPVWNPDDLSKVEPSTLATILEGAEGFVPFKPLNNITYREYPHKYGLPSEKDVELYVTGEDGSNRSFKATRKEVIEAFTLRGHKKHGTRFKIEDILNRKTTPAKDAPEYLDWAY